ncbi:LysM domain-containing protein [Microbacterium deminutum]|uniref:LysM domain-containing protein n=1 Tax=Microbacterium deminutum TaxID=344164 RepID=A0ABP5CTU4_9MICO
MNRTAKVTAAVSAVAIVSLLALAAPAVAGTVTELASWPMFRAQAEPKADPTPTNEHAAGARAADEKDGPVYLGDGISRPAGGPGNCTTSAFINITGSDNSPSYGKLLGELTDMGATEYADGPVGYTADGLIETYTVQPNDSLISIGERFCVDYVTVGSYNHRFGSTAIQPGDVLVLRPDPSVPWFDYSSPRDAPGGFVTATYREAIGKMRTAAVHGDLVAARDVWDSYLADVMGPTAAVVGQAISDSNVTLLRKMFP